MVKLDSVALYALDIITGPYLHCSAPSGDATAMPFHTSLTCRSETLCPESSARHRSSVLGDVFVPRSEFCRRVLWMYVAESGLLCLYYPEEIPGEVYPRQTLRYTLSFNFRVDEKLVTVGESLLRQLIQPYSVLLTNVAGELRTAEMKYHYVFSRLMDEHPAGCRVADESRKVKGPETPESVTPEVSGKWEGHRSAATASLPHSPCFRTRNSFITQNSPPQWTSLPALVQALYDSLETLDGAHLPSGSGSIDHGAAVRISNRLVFHVRYVPPLQRVQPIRLDDVPVCCISRSASRDLESLDLLVRQVLQRMDGQQTVADLVFGVARNTSTTLADIFALATTPRCAEAELENTSQSSSLMNEVDAESQVGERRLRVPLHCMRWGGSEGASYTTVTVRPVVREGRPTAGAAGWTIALELPPTWPHLLDGVTEALLQLEANKAVKRLKHWAPDTIYSTTERLQEVLSRADHPARHKVGRFLLGVQHCRASGAAARTQRRRHTLRYAVASSGSRSWTLHVTSEPEPEPVPPFHPPGVLLSLVGSPLYMPEGEELSSSSEECGEDRGSPDSEADTVAQAAAAVICALGKFTFVTARAVQHEMRCLPVFSSMFDHWSLECCKALVQVGVLNGWLCEVDS